MLTKLLVFTKTATTMYGVVMENTVKTLLAQGISQRRISRELGISRKVVRRIKSQLETTTLSKGYFREGKLAQHEATVRSYLDKGFSSVLIHQKLVSVHGLDVSYHTVRRFVSGLKVQEVFVPIIIGPGEEAQVDFGYLGRFVQEDGTSVKAWVFCMVLSHSRYAYYEAVTDQSVTTFINCHIHAFEFFGGVPLWVLLDNLRAGVLRPDFFEPILQEQYSEFLAHYGCAGKPCRVRKPEHKGKVESGVKYVKYNFLKGLEHRSFGRLAGELARWNTDVCNVRTHGTTRKVPVEVFAQTERMALLQLPATRYEVYHWEHRKANRMGHVTFRYNYYSVPYTLAGQVLCVKSNGSIVKICQGRKEVALHLLAKGKGQYTTRPEHLPPHKQPKGEAHYRERLLEIGPSAVALMDAFMLHNRHWKEKVQGILHLKSRYPAVIIDLACKRALEYGAFSYQAVKNICRLELVEVPPEDALPADLGGFNHDLALYDGLAGA